jgi:hypothetical protein
MSFDFASDSVLRGKLYPALAEWQATPYTPEWRQFVYHWPYTVPAELIEHCALHNYPYTLNKDAKYYIIGIGFFSFDVDYFGLIPQWVYDHNLTILFYYHEGDSPYRIKQRLDSLCVQHNLSTDCYRFVSGNTEADKIPGFVYFPDHELLYWQRNHNVVPCTIHSNKRGHDFTVLSRTHKPWRATLMADLSRRGILDNSFWSYRTDIQLDNDIQNPIRVTTYFPGLAEYTEEFLAGAPYTCDSLTSDEHNDHSQHQPEHYIDSYCNIVLETHFDVDQSMGAFLTEKTFKPIKHGQPFVIAGGPGSLEALRNLGYRTFDHAIDNGYDLEPDPAQRWLKLLTAIRKIKEQDMQVWFNQCREDIEHNQQLFVSTKYSRLNNLYDKLTHQLATT